ncbi:hypothetical protein BKA63DRAFT_225791 [Paraphoma chrysanthemicola]|nr:hypothetical protein BKA63DRAFT_225791 [Paraphoma chrysanthemicola]
MRLNCLVTTSSVIAMVRARCYELTTDIYGQSMAGAEAAVGEFCAYDLSGYFTESQIKYRCLQLPRNKVEFWVGWKGNGAWTLNIEDSLIRSSELISRRCI